MAKKDELNFENENGASQQPSNEKLKALQMAMEKIEKNFGKGSIMRMGSQEVEHVEVIPTGSIGLNVALGGLKKLEALPPLLMQNMLSTVSMLPSWA